MVSSCESAHSTGRGCGRPGEFNHNNDNTGFLNSPISRVGVA